MKNITKMIVLLMTVSIIFAAGDFHKTKSYQIGPGTYYSEYTHPEPWVLYVVEIDATNPYLSFESVKANDYLFAFEGPSSMSNRYNAPGHEVLSAINGDYYNTSTGEPISTHAVNGEFVKIVNNTRTTVSINKLNKPTIVRADFSGAVLAKDTSSQWVSYPLANVNAARGENQLVMFNDFWRATTQTNEYGHECLAQAIDEWVINDTVRCVILSKELNQGNMSIPDNKVVLSGHGIAATYINDHFSVGDTVKIVQSLANNLAQLTTVVGGGPHMMENGVDVVDVNRVIEGLGLTHCSYRHPRTALGFNQDSTRIYYVLVDGRQAGFSVGMSLYELNDFMREIGIRHAINLDGGGSSAMVVRNSIMNRPSDGSERRVASGLLCVSNAPRGDWTYIQFKQDSLAVFKNSKVNTNLTAWDEYYNPVGISAWSSVNVSYNTAIGTFVENTFTAAEENGDTYLVANYNGDIDSLLIHIIELYDLDVYPEAVTIDSVNGVNLEVRAVDESDVTSLYDNDIFEFTVQDPAVASVDTNGFVIGKTSGETKVIVRYGDQRDTVLVSVEIGEGEVVVDEIESIDDWTISGDTYINMSGTSMSLVDRTAGTGSKAVKVDYERTGSEDGMISIATDPVNIYGVPSYILVDVLADSQKNWIYIDLQDARGVDYSVKCSSSLRYKDDYRTQYLEMANLLPADGEQLYPLKITGIRLRIDDKATTGSMYIDRIRLIYPGWTAIDDPEVLIPGTHVLYQNYPNPFNPSTTIEYDLSKSSHVDLSVYDLKGEKVATLVNGIQVGGHHNISFDASLLPGGVYIYRLQAGNWADTKKMLLIK
jgi:exopolysaccharide biosynthesis protein